MAPKDNLARTSTETGGKDLEGNQGSPQPKYLKIRILAIPTDTPLPCDIFVQLKDQFFLFRKEGDILTTERLEQLKNEGRREVFIPEEQQSLFVKELQKRIQERNQSLQEQARFIKETAFMHVSNLFTTNHIDETVSASRDLIEQMINFVSSDIHATTSLLSLSTHDYYTYNHSVDVAIYSILLAKQFFGEDKEILMHAGMGGLLHDIGKRDIDVKIINKPGVLNAKEWETIKQHPTLGKDILSSIDSVPTESKNIVFEHHECFDGSGYPRGLKQDAISKLARIVSIADVFDALTTTRSYKKALETKTALEVMFSMQPGKFDPDLFKIFDKYFKRRGRFILDASFDPCQPGDFHDHLKPSPK